MGHGAPLNAVHPNPGSASYPVSRPETAVGTLRFNRKTPVSNSVFRIVPISRGMRSGSVWGSAALRHQGFDVANRRAASRHSRGT